MSIVEQSPIISHDGLASKRPSESDATAFSAFQSDSHSPRRSWGNVSDELLDLYELKDDWDGLGAAAPSQGLVRICADFMRSVREKGNPPPSFVRPTPDGNICFEWQTDSERYEIEISDNFIEVIQVTPSGTTCYQHSTIVS